MRKQVLMILATRFVRSMIYPFENILPRTMLKVRNLTPGFIVPLLTRGYLYVAPTALLSFENPRLR